MRVRCVPVLGEGVLWVRVAVGRIHFDFFSAFRGVSCAFSIYIPFFRTFVEAELSRSAGRVRAGRAVVGVIEQRTDVAKL